MAKTANTSETNSDELRQKFTACIKRLLVWTKGIRRIGDISQRLQPTAWQARHLAQELGLPAPLTIEFLHRTHEEGTVTHKDTLRLVAPDGQARNTVINWTVRPKDWNLTDVALDGDTVQGPRDGLRFPQPDVTELRQDIEAFLHNWIIYLESPSGEYLAAAEGKDGGVVRGESRPRFPTPKGANWKDVQISFMNSDTVRVKTHDKEQVVTAGEAGFSDGRNGRTNSQWRLLETCAKKKLIEKPVVRTAYKESSTSPAMGIARHQSGSDVEKQKERLDTGLQTYFGISDLAFRFDDEEQGWLPNFILIPQPEM